MSRRLGVLISSFFLLVAASQSHALSVAASTGSDSYSVDISQSIFPRFRAGLGYLRTDDSGRDARMYTGSLMFAPIIPGLDLTLGGRYQYQDTDYGDGGGVGLGGTLAVDTPIPRVTVGGYGFYMPDGLTHGDIGQSYEYGAQVRATVISQTYVYGGYRYWRSEFDGRDGETLQSGPVFGVSVGF